MTLGPQEQGLVVGCNLETMCQVVEVGHVFMRMPVPRGTNPPEYRPARPAAERDTSASKGVCPSRNFPCVLFW